MGFWFHEKVSCRNRNWSWAVQSCNKILDISQLIENQLEIIAGYCRLQIARSARNSLKIAQYCTIETIVSLIRAVRNGFDDLFWPPDGWIIARSQLIAKLITERASRHCLMTNVLLNYSCTLNMRCSVRASQSLKHKSELGNARANFDQKV